MIVYDYIKIQVRYRSLLLIGSLALPDLAKFFGGGAPPHPPLGMPCKAKISPAEYASVYLSR